MVKAEQGEREGGGEGERERGRRGKRVDLVEEVLEMGQEHAQAHLAVGRRDG